MAEDEVQFGELEVALPTASEGRCMIMHDLAKLLSVQTNALAQAMFQEGWRSAGHRGRLELDHEQGFVFIYGGRDAIAEAAILIHDLAGRPLSAELVASARQRIRLAKRPPRVKWSVGDLFAVPLGEGSFAFGQVIFEQEFAAGSGVRAPTCVLLEHRTAQPHTIDAEEVLTSRSLAILHELSTALDVGEWLVVGHADPIANPRAGRCGFPGEAGCMSGSSLGPLARAYWGVDPWNVLAQQDHWDRLLLSGVSRPSHARILSAGERRAYRREVFGIVE